MSFLDVVIETDLKVKGGLRAEAEVIGLEPHPSKIGLYIYDDGDRKVFVDFRNTEDGAIYGYSGETNSSMKKDDSVAVIKEVVQTYINTKSEPEEGQEVEEDIEDKLEVIESPILKVEEQVEEPQNEFSIMEARDEEQILSEIRGEVLDEFVYDFEVNGKKVTGLSYAGVKAFAQHMGDMIPSERLIQESPEGWMASVKMTDTKRNIGFYGVSFQAKKTKNWNGIEVADQFSLQKALSKAQRNALRALMPEKVVIQMINEWKSRER